MGRFETEYLIQEDNLKGLARPSGWNELWPIRYTGE